MRTTYCAFCINFLHLVSFMLFFITSWGLLPFTLHLYTVCTFSVYFNAVRCDLLPHDTVSVFIPVCVQSAWWWPIWEVETSSQTMNWSPAVSCVWQDVSIEGTASRFPGALMVIEFHDVTFRQPKCFAWRLWSAKLIRCIRDSVAARSKHTHTHTHTHTHRISSLLQRPVGEWCLKIISLL